MRRVWFTNDEGKLTFGGHDSVVIGSQWRGSHDTRGGRRLGRKV